MKNKKSLGQHWLYDKQILGAIATLAADDVNLCVEIGPGLGTLTSHLLKKFPKVLAIEFDKRLAENLPKSFPGKNLAVVNEDILKFDFAGIKESYVVAGNIPYYITSPIIDKLLSATPLPAKIVLLIQKEVAERAVAGPGKHSILSLTTQNRAEASPGLFVAKELFTPPPKVDSELLILKPRRRPLVSEAAISLAKLGFSAPRKKVGTNLATALHLPKEQVLAAFAHAKISPDLRPADLSHEDWQALADIILPKNAENS